MKRLGFVLLIFLLGVLSVLSFQQLQAQTATCYGISFGVEIRPEAQAALEAQGYLVPNVELEMRQALDRSYQMNGVCFTGEMGQIHGTNPRVFAVFQAVSEDYGVLRIMTEAQYYPEPFPENSSGWSDAR